MQIILIRHGESQANIGMSSHHDSSLTDRGRAQMRATAHCLFTKLEDVSEWTGIASPYLRTLQSAEPIARQLGIAFSVDWNVREYLGPNGTRDESRQIPRRRPGSDLIDAILGTAPNDATPWVELPESPPELCARIESFVTARVPGHKNLIIVSHGASVVMLSEVLRARGSRYPGWKEQIPNASITWFRDGRELCYADTGHLREEILGSRDI